MAGSLVYLKLTLYLQQSDGLSQVLFVHFCPFGQLVQVACLAAFFA
jgi:hypothetical protein